MNQNKTKYQKDKIHHTFHLNVLSNYLKNRVYKEINQYKHSNYNLYRCMINMNN